MSLFLKIVLLLAVGSVFSQNTNLDPLPSEKIDSLYREDQFYFGFTYNTLQKKPDGLTQSKFSKGFSVGFLRDMPVNKMRTIAIATGIGISFNNLNQNILISKTNQTPTYALINSDISYQKNRISQLLIDVPIEFRWRSSTFESHKFWRIYGGAKFSYLVNDRSIYNNYQDKIIVNNNPDFNKLNYGVYLAAGYNTINLYGYYGLNPIFQSAKIGTESIDMNSLNVGIIFYIL
ncbi:porin family protein [Flavobacterium sp.]|uniref:porin family protein n=1 Tax=Flavobacterium sp. TaxID=239 RepID=UPI0038FC98B9